MSCCKTASYCSNYPPVLVQTMMRNTVERWPEHKALAIKRNGQWQFWNYLQYHQDVRKVAKGFLALGLQRFHGVGIMGANSPEERARASTGPKKPALYKIMLANNWCN